RAVIRYAIDHFVAFDRARDVDDGRRAASGELQRVRQEVPPDEPQHRRIAHGGRQRTDVPFDVAAGDVRLVFANDFAHETPGVDGHTSNVGSGHARELQQVV